MKRLVFSSILIFSFLIHILGQPEKDVHSTIRKVIVYKEGAEIKRSAVFDLQPGKTILNFTNLSPYINIESIRVDGDGNYTILNVQQQNDYLNRLEKSSEITKLKKEIGELQDKIEDEETWIRILNDKMVFLKTNQEVTGKEQALNPETFKSLNAIYGSNLETLNLEIQSLRQMPRPS